MLLQRRNQRRSVVDHPRRFFNFFIMRHTFSECTNDKVSVGATTTVVVTADTDRFYLSLVNDSDEDIYLGLGADAVMNKGIRLNSGGGSVVFEGNAAFVGRVNAICASGTKNMTVCTSP